MKRTNVSDKLKAKVRKSSKYRCGFCLFQESYSHTTFQIDHIIPIAKSGTNDEENLWLVCETCNRAKSDKVEGFDSVTNSNSLLFNPRTQIWHEHFEWVDNYTQICGKTKVGRVTVKELNLNKERLIKVRNNWVTVGWHPPKD
jgi:CRISPR/Cas system Type II protein with McrA/HNH and RuvC-like nuclease domain